MQTKIAKALAFILVETILSLAVRDFFNIAWGTGAWLGQLSPKWGLSFFIFLIIALLTIGFIYLALWQPARAQPLETKIVPLRNRLAILHNPLILILLFLPIWLFQYHIYGLVFTSPFIRLTVWMWTTTLTAFLLSGASSRALSGSAVLTSFTLSGATILIAFALREVSSYPFSLGWSEGNRLYDYSIYFGRDRYISDSSQVINPYLDLSRQYISGLPFLYSALTIWQARLWQALTNIVPFIALGLIVFYRRGQPKTIWFLAGLWAFAFLRQGPIHPPLVIAAAIIAFAWRRPLWQAIPLLALGMLIPAQSRFTWLFGAMLWAGVFSFVGAPLESGRVPRSAWARALLLGTVSALSGLAVRLFWPDEKAGAAYLVSSISESTSRQELLWYRLLPNSTLGPGVLIILLVAVLPLILILIYFLRAQWTLHFSQKLALFGCLTSFFVVGLTASTKIGGGGDLHNLDLFLIGLLFSAGLVWNKFGHEWILNRAALPMWMQVTLILLLALPVWAPLINMRPLADTSQIEELTGLLDPAELRPSNFLASDADVEKSLTSLRKNVLTAQQRGGEVLFLDQRQLLTFGEISGLPLVADYEKKRLMDQAMTGNAATLLAQFHADLKSHRFILIITEPLHLPVQGESSVFGEESDAWVKWISSVVLCYYQPSAELSEVKVDLLVPRRKPATHCSLPVEFK